MLRKSALVAFSIAISASVLFAAAGDGRWLNKVPGKDRARPNPLAGNAGAIAGGEKLFHQNCASCHGSDASGRGKLRRCAQTGFAAPRQANSTGCSLTAACAMVCLHGQNCRNSSAGNL